MLRTPLACLLQASAQSVCCVSACLRDDDSIDDDDDGGEGGDDDNNKKRRYGIPARSPPTFVINNTARNLLVGNRSFRTKKQICRSNSTQHTCATTARVNNTNITEI